MERRIDRSVSGTERETPRIEIYWMDIPHLPNTISALNERNFRRADSPPPPYTPVDEANTRNMGYTNSENSPGEPTPFTILEPAPDYDGGVTESNMNSPVTSRVDCDVDSGTYSYTSWLAEN